VAKVNSVRPHPNADRLQLADIRGNTVVVDLHTQAGQLGIFFPEGGQLSEAYAQSNDLVRRIDENGNRAGGMFDSNRRVRAMRLRGVSSDGYFAPLSSLLALDPGFNIDALKDGQDLNEVGGFTLATKYYTQAAQQQMAAGTYKAPRVVAEFDEHVSSAHFRRVKDAIPTGTFITITEKLHGTSGRTYYGRDRNSETWWDRVKAFFCRPTLKLITGTRRVIVTPAKAETGFYGSNQFRLEISESLRGKLRPGEAVYYEIVGWGNGRPLQPAGKYGKLAKAGVKEPKAKFGDNVPWSYGCAEGEYAVYVYNITQDRKPLPAYEMVARALELGLKVPPLLVSVNYDEDFRPGELERIVEQLTEGDSLLGPHIREGVIVRVDHPHGEVQFVKSKSTTFCLLEEELRDDESFVDVEDLTAASVEEFPV
jgi:hypothetical protein